MMESPSRALTLSLQQPPPQLLHQCSRRHRSSTDSTSNSPEFEFWNIGRCPEPCSPLHSADELFSDGFLLPLHFVPAHRSEPDHEHESGPDLEIEPGSSQIPVEPSPLITSEITSSSNPILSASKRWKEIFKRGEKKGGNSSSNSNSSSGSNNNKSEEIKVEKVEKKRKKEKKNSNGTVGNNSAELNINIWPFSRSRSAGNNSGRSKPASNRKVSSAPCSRSNSSGESKSSRRSWPNSPGRAGVHLGRASPVWHIKRNGPGSWASTSGSGSHGGGAKGRVLKLNVPVCIGYRQHLSCRSDENGAVTGVGNDGLGAKSGGASGNNSNLFGLRGLFSKKNTVLTV